MAVNISAWLGAGEAISETERAALAWRRIQDKSTTVTFKTATGATVTPQTVRVESDTSATPAESAAGVGARRRVIVFGIRNHATLPDTDIQDGYRFVWAGDQYTCVDTILTLGEIQGIFEATQ